VILVGILLSAVGSIWKPGEERMTFGWNELADGIDFAVARDGHFRLRRDHPQPRDHRNAGRSQSADRAAAAGLRRAASVGRPDCAAARFSALCSACCPATAPCSPFASYTLEKKIASDPSRFGQGAIRGCRRSESANNAGAQTSFIPLLTLGIPPNAVMALMVGP